MSSLRNAIQRRNHKERAQPKEREKWGILEKHKDYSLRAKDYNEKKKRLKILRLKASDRNPDEFHFGMMKNRISESGQKLASRGNQVLSQDAVKLLKTQDIGYLRTMRQSVRRLKQKAEQELLLQQSSQDIMNKAYKSNTKSIPRKHVVFVDTSDHQRVCFPARSSTTTSIPGLEPIFGGPKTHREDEDEDMSASEPNSIDPRESRSKENLSLHGIQSSGPEHGFQEVRALRKRRKRDLVARQIKLEACARREHDIIDAERELELQRNKMSNCTGVVTKAGLKFMVRERKR